MCNKINMTQKQYIMTIIVVCLCIIISSIAIYVVSVVQQDTKIDDDSEQSMITRIQYQGQYYQVPVRHLESDVAKYIIPIDTELPEKREVIFIYKGNDSVQVQAGMFQIAQVVRSLFVVNVDIGEKVNCTSEKDYYIVLEEKKYSEAKREGTCLFLYGNAEELDQQSSAFVYALKSSINAGFL